MSLFRLSTAAPSAHAKYYLDTSAIVPLAWQDGATKGRLPAPDSLELDRANLVKHFASKAVTADADLRTSLLVLEEIAFRWRRQTRSELSGKHGFKDWKAYSQAKPTDARNDALIAQAKAVVWVECAVDALSAIGVVFERRAIAHSSATMMCTKLRKTYHEVLAKHSTLDAMDALHIAVGLELGARAFITFDEGWQSVSTIDVFHD